MVLRKIILIVTILAALLLCSCGSQSGETVAQTNDNSSGVENTPTSLINDTDKDVETNAGVDVTEEPVPDLLPMYLMYDGNMYVYGDNITDPKNFPEMNDETQIGEILSSKNEVPKEEFSATFAYIGAKLYSMPGDCIAVYLDKSVCGTELIDVEPHVLVLKKQGND